jgi:sulfatase modifying factor 1
VLQGCARDDDCVSRACVNQICVCPAGTVTADRPSSELTRKYCMDATEVTNADYSAFLQGCAANQSCVTGLALPRACAWKTSFVPGDSGECDSSTFDPIKRANYPVVCVDWCDALAFCRSRGKRLCNQYGRPGPFAQPSVSESEWYNACSFGSNFEFPYSEKSPFYDPEICNGADKAAGLLEVKSLPDCVAGYRSIHDLSGNVSEWEDACQSEQGKEDGCRVRGGSFKSSEQELRCNSTIVRSRETRAADVGFRCCGG